MTDRNTGSIGAASELIASADLLSLGYEVFRSLDHTGPTDLVVRTPGGEVIFIEVKTAYHGKPVRVASLDPDVADIVAVVDVPSRQVRYKGILTNLWGDTPLRLRHPIMFPFPEKS